MTFNGREEVLAALREIEAMKEGRQVPDGDFYAHVDFQLVVTYMGRLPLEYSAEGYVSTDRVEDLQPAVRKTFKRIADTDIVFKTLDEECRRTEEGNDGERKGYGTKEEGEPDCD